ADWAAGGARCARSAWVDRAGEVGIIGVLDRGFLVRSGCSGKETIMTVSRPARVRVNGPLKAYAEGFCADLTGKGYTLWSATGQLSTDAEKWIWPNFRMLLVILGGVSRQSRRGRAVADGFVVVDVGRAGVERVERCRYRQR